MVERAGGRSKKRTDWGCGGNLEAEEWGGGGARETEPETDEATEG
jgi:hypothetical protein